MNLKKDHNLLPSVMQLLHRDGNQIQVFMSPKIHVLLSLSHFMEASHYLHREKSSAVVYLANDNA